MAAGPSKATATQESADGHAIDEYPFAGSGIAGGGDRTCWALTCLSRSPTVRIRVPVVMHFATAYRAVLQRSHPIAWGHRKELAEFETTCRQGGDGRGARGP